MSSQPSSSFVWGTFASGILLGALIMFGLMASGLLDKLLGSPPKHPQWGYFVKDPVATWLPDGRLMKLNDSFTYVDPTGKAWTSKKDAIINGASIPKAVWSITGGPFEGKYRNASIVHDTACDEKTETSDDVHRMFYNACRCGGVEEIQAKILFWAVYNGGPKWAIVEETRMMDIMTFDGTVEKVNVSVKIPKMLMASQKIDADALKRIEKEIRDKNPSLETLMQLK